MAKKKRVVEYVQLDETNIEEIDNYVHRLAAKHGRKLLEVKNATVRVEKNIDALRACLDTLAKQDLLHDREKFYPFRPKRIQVHELNEKYIFLERLINTNNRNKGLFTEYIIQSMLLKKYDYFVEFFKILIHSYIKSDFDKELIEIYDKYIGCFDKIIVNEDDIKWLRKRKNQIRFYNLLTKGGHINEKGHTVDCIYSLAYNQLTFKTVDKEHEINKNYKPMTFYYSYNHIPLSEDTIRNLIKYGYLNKNHVYGTIYEPVIERDFYIPKKKRRKRIYIEDVEYLTYNISNSCLKSLFYTRGQYNKIVPKIIRDKKAFKKQYIPSKEREIVIVYHLNFLCSKEKKKLIEGLKKKKGPKIKNKR